ncbi:MAG TPA: glycoside hydrolase family 43 protein [Acidimicrobiia bacterium]|jgi:hypothetical protein|nr:glycoside hydrolase family 43 protein [Acidimicrobiia bacterium]
MDRRGRRGVGFAAAATVALVAVLAGCAYTNPVSAPPDPAGLPDPFVVLVNGVYHAYTTNGPDVDHPTMNIQHVTSTDLVHWSAPTDVLPTLPSWAVAGRTWAPSVLVRGGASPTYVLYFTAQPADRATNGTHCIGTAVASTPDGPFTPRATPLVCQTDHNGAIDPSAFVDPVNGQAFLFWKSEDNLFVPARPTIIWAQPLSADGLSFASGSAPSAVMTASSNWEHGQIEAPAMTYDAASGRYVVFYAGHYWYNEPAYGTGWAVCTRTATGFAAGSCTRGQSTQWIASTAHACAPAGVEVFSDNAGYRWLAYHAYVGPADPSTGKCTGARKLRIDKLCFANGVPRTNAPSTGAQTLTRTANCATDIP